MISHPSVKRPFIIAFIAVSIAFAWQALTVQYNYGGNWTALFCTGALFKPPPQPLVSEHIYVFANSTGYDGQIYHYMAHDPFLRRGFQASMDAPRYRYRRILAPFIAWLLAAGQDRFIDAAIFASTLLAVFLGTWWTARIALDCNRNPAWSLGFLLLPAITISLDRMTIDGALAAVTAGLVYAVRRDAWREGFILCAAACLIRESGVLLPVGIILWLVTHRKFRHACAMACSLLPMAVWYQYVNARTEPEPFDVLSSIPFLGLGRRFFTSYPYDLGTALNLTATILDDAALAAMLVAVLYCAIHWRWLFRDPSGQMALAFLALLATVANPDVWMEVYAFGRGFSPFLLLVALDGFRTQSPLAALPIALIAPRVILQIGPQIINVTRGALGV